MKWKAKRFSSSNSIQFHQNSRKRVKKNVYSNSTSLNRRVSSASISPHGQILIKITVVNGLDFARALLVQKHYDGRGIWRIFTESGVRMRCPQIWWPCGAHMTVIRTIHHKYHRTLWYTFKFYLNRNLFHRIDSKEILIY